ncbi:MAG: right-handed parallel beta-helix repeat-containing protein [Clostridia bacterium]|nr:right-handed parallel beta-helix repeat-containing protein [Clostridia bacterium]
MKPFDTSTKFESNTHYFYNEDKLCFALSDTTHLEEKIYRAIYMSKKTWLDTAIYLKDLSNVTLDFGGATLLLGDDTIQPFVLDGCHNVTIKNVIIEYERSLMNEMDVVQITDGEIRCLQTEKQKRHFPLRVENGCLIPIAGDKKYPDAFKVPMFFNLYDKDTQECKKTYLVRIGTELPYLSKEQYPFHYLDLIAEQKDEYIILRGAISPQAFHNVTGVISHSRRDVSSCFIIRSRNTVLENVRILNGAGMGILGMYSENITLDGVRYCFDERSHGIATNAADAVHLISCFGRVEIVNSVFEGMKDDALNIHCNYYTVQSVEGNVIHAKLNTDIQASPGVNAHYKMFDKGDKLSICRGNTAFLKQNLTVEQVEITGDFTADIYFNGDPHNICEGDTIENLSIQADLHIKNCRFGKAATHLRLQTGGKVLIEDCECSLKIALTGDKNYWYEGSPINDLTIRNCRFVGKKGCIVACPSFDACPEAPYYHSGIKISQNTFDVTTALDLSHCKDVLFEGNIQSAGLPFENRFQNCTDIIEK